MDQFSPRPGSGPQARPKPATRRPHPAARARLVAGAASFAAMGGMVGGMAVNHLVATHTTRVQSTTNPASANSTGTTGTTGTAGTQPSGDDGTFQGDDGQTQTQTQTQNQNQNGGFTTDNGASAPSNLSGGPANGQSHGS